VSGEVVLYVEGGSTDKARLRRLAEGFETFLAEGLKADDVSDERLVIFLCGGGGEARQVFEVGRCDQPCNSHVLLIDSEGPVMQEPPEDEHLMVQCTESWFLADPDRLYRFYGEQPPRAEYAPCVETIPKKEVLEALAVISAGSIQGGYSKKWHAPKLLRKIRPELVRARAPHCERLFQHLGRVLAA
jgi:hypothetical protein